MFLPLFFPCAAYYNWTKDFLEGGKAPLQWDARRHTNNSGGRRFAGDARGSTLKRGERRNHEVGKVGTNRPAGEPSVDDDAGQGPACDSLEVGG